MNFWSDVRLRKTYETVRRFYRFEINASFYSVNTLNIILLHFLSFAIKISLLGKYVKKRDIK